MAMQQDGIIGEQLLSSLLKQQKIHFFQPDAIGKQKDKWYVFECKHQEHFTNPAGHGLPQYQVESRLNFQKETGIKVLFVIFEKPFDKTKIVYYNFLDKLEKSSPFFSANHKRKIYPLYSFLKISEESDKELIDLLMEKWPLIIKSINTSMDT